MFTVYWILAGLLTFTGAAALLGRQLRHKPSKENAERSSRIMHTLFFAGLIAPGTLALFYPGLTRFDDLLGMPSLPVRAAFLGLGILMLIPGFYLLVGSNMLLRTKGSGANAFVLTRRIVADDLYRRTRNPMSLGYYLCNLALGFMAGSTSITLGALLLVIPAHLFFLLYFEETELALRLGDSYLVYKRNTPFLFPRLSAVKEVA